MAVDKKSQHVGNHGGVYTDIDGMTKQFTVIDHDKHTTRLSSGREYKTPEVVIPTPEQELVNDIHGAGMSRSQTFIEGYDGEIAKKYGFERFHKGRSVENLTREYEDKNWYQDLEKLFKKSLKERIATLQKYLNKDYGV